ncbi:homoserine dehydrogenase [Planococcus salinus]|uniref:Homoserine dehydrogenase n=1 Tax=Planococcus salinus TaxID=1848460 RepID=A0A3M8P8Z9_9BACL|nr:homoserine dehydrogenase [Planococcus salinus]RNF40147.1 homoserine dehydrogenase [Planococcus salinus]
MSVVNAAILGFGTVGEGVYRTIQSHQEELEAALGKPVKVVAVLVKNEHKSREIETDVLVTTEIEEIFNLPDLHVIFEAIVDKEPSFTYLKQAIAKGCHVITANKEMFCYHGQELLDLAQKQRVGVGYEASVAGGIPIIQTLQQLLNINNVTAIQGILNGTSNFILTEMREQKQSFEAALALAQQKGYAEADPGNDIYGCDAFYKLMILSGLVFGEQPDLKSVKINGITGITLEQIELADQWGLRFKHLASIEKKQERLHASVTPVLVSQSHPLYHVEGVDNAVNVTGDLVGDITLQGPGAGMYPTASAMVEDLVHVLQKPAGEKARNKAASKIIKENGEQDASYWLVSNIKQEQLSNAGIDFEQLEESFFAAKASPAQIEQLKEQEDGTTVYYPIVGTFELKNEHKETHLIGAHG